ncbi:hypothetical protein HanRHA438_Chr03g0108061 [Helianthus annuus]|nr:hypothetical protein HanRHA438_Chr03g0108061 [Helianthus annuus]
MLFKLSISCVCASAFTLHCMGIYTHTQVVYPEGFDRWSEGSSIEDKPFEG